MTRAVEASEFFLPAHTFADRHIGPRADDARAMLAELGVASLDELIAQAVPEGIRSSRPLSIPPGLSEHEALTRLRALAGRNQVFRSLIGMGYYDTITPPVIQRNILENPGWYTQYTPYQAEISQGRLEALLNFQTMVADLTGLPLANASLLDEATAAAEAMSMCRAIQRDVGGRDAFFVAADCHPQTIAVVRTRAAPLGIRVVVGDPAEIELERGGFFGVLLQYPTTDGRVCNYEPHVERAHDAGALVVVATDLLALTLLRPPGEFGADVAIGSAQRFGVPLGYGGPHAAFMAVRDEYKRQLPGRLIGVSKDAQGRTGYRLAIQTREQHIRREKATSNICTAQVLLAVMAGMYAVWHGPEGLRRIAQRVHAHAALLAAALRQLGHTVATDVFFDTLRIVPGAGHTPLGIIGLAREQGINLRDHGDGALGVALDELTDAEELDKLLACFNRGQPVRRDDHALDQVNVDLPGPCARRSAFLTHPVFNRYHAEHELLRYIKRLESRDLSLTTSMIPLGSCTMKLNAAAEMLPVSWPEFARLHPFCPPEQAAGYTELFRELEEWLSEITGFPAISLQPNAGSQGEYAGLMVIRAYHQQRGQGHRDVCLIPTSAHGTNPASAVTAGMRVVAVGCNERGDIDIEDLAAKAAEHADRLAALMVTYPSTHGVFEAGIREICRIVHQHGGQVYMDGANLNAQVGLTRPAEIGADVCHLNLHKTFCIPHGGGGPGMGPIGVAAPLAPFLPGHPVVEPEWSIHDPPPHNKGKHAIGPVSAATYGSPSILVISWMYIAMMGGPGLRRATEMAILNANYMARRLEGHYPVLYRGSQGSSAVHPGRVAHEFILDCRRFEETADIKVEDIAKRLMDYGFHAPTMSFPVPGTLMIEPTESESREELDRLCDALIAIREEIRALEERGAGAPDNPLKNAPHTAAMVSASDWPHAYSREQAAFPAPWLREHKFWPPVARIDNVYGDRHLFCTCPPVS